MSVSRLFEIVYVLLELPTVTAGDLARRFEVSERTIYRDIECLSQAGIPVYMRKGKGGGISLLPGFVLDKAVLTEGEKEDILSSMRAVAALRPTENSSALAKLQNLLGKRSCDWIEVDLSSWGYFGNDAATFETVKTAILEKRELHFLYASGKAEKLPREVEPLKLLFKGAAWYLYAFCKLRGECRFFKLRRIENAILTERHFDRVVPEQILLPDTSDKTSYFAATVRISSRMAFRVYDEISKYHVLPNGDFLCELLLPDIDTLCSYTSSFGEFATILTPNDAVAEMIRRLDSARKNYPSID